MIYKFEVEIGDGVTGIVGKVNLFASYDVLDYDGDLEIEIQEIFLDNNFPEFIDYAVLDFYRNKVDWDQLQNQIFRETLQ